MSFALQSPVPRTFANMTFAEATAVCEAKPHVIVRDDPMFGRRGYASRVIADETHGFLVLVVVFCAKASRNGQWREHLNPPPEARQFWRPDRLELL